MNAPLFMLATRPKHAFNLDKEERIPAEPALNRGAQIERVCTRCGVIKITAFGLDGNGGERLWRLPGATAQQADDPGCVGEGER